MAEWTGTFAGQGLYPGIPEDEYHRDVVPEGSLSVSGAKKLLAPSCPAVYRYEADHPKRASRSMDMGTVVHGMILGTGQPVEVLDFGDYKKKAAQEARDAAIAAGKVPMLAREHDQAAAIARAVRDHEIAGGLFVQGDAETSMFWRDEEFGIWLRGRNDYLTYFGQTPVIVDLKTGRDSSPDGFNKAVDEYRYYMQDVWYREGLAAILGCEPDDIDFVFAVVPTTPPYLVMTYQLEPEWRALGRECSRIARETFRDCTASGIWPPWARDIEPLEPPRWAKLRIEKEINEYYD